jgi:3-hydroxybutyryl-CoA dehydratase
MLKIGAQYLEEIKITSELISRFAEFSGDFNPVHLNDEAAIAQGFKERIAHGMLSASFFSKILANSFPGPGTIYLNQTLKFHAPVYVNEILTFRLEVMAEKENKPIFTIKTEALGADKLLRISGEAIIRTPSS